MPPDRLSVEASTEAEACSSEESSFRHRKSAKTKASVTSPEPSGSEWAWYRGKSALAICTLCAFAPLLGLMAAVAWLRDQIFQDSFQTKQASKKLRILVTGGKMSKASAVARAVGRAGHTVFTAEVLPYRYCHTRFCRYVSKHYTLPRPTVQPKEWLETIQAIVAEQQIDLIIPCTAPVESSAYSHLWKSLPANVRVFALDGTTCDKLDNKYIFNQVLAKASLPCPETAQMTCLADAVQFFKDRETKPDGKKFIVKPAVYDPKARSEILFLPIQDKKRQIDYLRSRNASEQVPYVIQEVLQDPEHGCYAIFNKGKLTGFEIFDSVASCLVYSPSQKHDEQVMELVAGLGKAMNLTGQLALDLMHTSTGQLVPIECNPRCHSAICTLEGHQNLSAIFTDPDFDPDLDPIVTSRAHVFRYWIMDQIFLMLGFWEPKNCFKLSFRQVLRGGDAILCGDDPMPFLAMYLLQITSLLLLELFEGTPWLKIDFCIGKIVKEGGD